MLKDWWAALLDLIFPPRCPICRKPLNKYGSVCLSCLAVVLHERQINIVARQLNNLDSCRILCDYTGGMRLLIHQLKFQQARQLAPYLSNLLTDYINPDLFTEVDLVVPVPLHLDKLAERGFNQTELIFRQWAETRGLTWLEVLERVRPTLPQWQLEAKKRRKNIKGAFLLTHPEYVQNKTILLVDDILTSGATLDECAKILKNGGAMKVIGLTLAGGNAK